MLDERTLDERLMLDENQTEEEGPYAVKRESMMVDVYKRQT